MKKKIKHRYRQARYIIYRETMVDPIDHVWTFVGGFLGIAIIGVSQTYLNILLNDKIFLIGSFGASAVLVYGIPNSPLAQPRNLIGGHLVSAFVGVTVCQLLGGFDIYWLAPSLAVALAIVGMQMTKTLHPPGGATALIANIGSAKIKELGYAYLFSPVFTGVIILYLVALLVNNLHADRKYPVRSR